MSQKCQTFQDFEKNYKKVKTSLEKAPPIERLCNNAVIEVCSFEIGDSKELTLDRRESFFPPELWDKIAILILEEANIVTSAFILPHSLVLSVTQDETKLNFAESLSEQFDSDHSINRVWKADLEEKIGSALALASSVLSLESGKGIYLQPFFSFFHTQKETLSFFINKVQELQGKSFLLDCSNTFSESGGWTPYADRGEKAEPVSKVLQKLSSRFSYYQGANSLKETGWLYFRKGPNSLFNQESSINIGIYSIIKGKLTNFEAEKDFIRFLCQLSCGASYRPLDVTAAFIPGTKEKIFIKNLKEISDETKEKFLQAFKKAGVAGVDFNVLSNKGSEHSLISRIAFFNGMTEEAFDFLIKHGFKPASTLGGKISKPQGIELLESLAFPFIYSNEKKAKGALKKWIEGVEGTPLHPSGLLQVSKRLLKMGLDTTFTNFDVRGLLKFLERQAWIKKWSDSFISCTLINTSKVMLDRYIKKKEFQNIEGAYEAFGEKIIGLYIGTDKKKGDGSQLVRFKNKCLLLKNSSRLYVKTENKVITFEPFPVIDPYKFSNEIFLLDIGNFFKSLKGRPLTDLVFKVHSEGGVGINLLTEERMYLEIVYPRTEDEKGLLLELKEQRKEIGKKEKKTIKTNS